MLILGIESSCDETAAAVVKDGRELLSNIISSQVKIHKKYGGVVPELASRKHVESIIPVVKEALREASVSLEEIEGIAVTKGPGLVGSLLVGISVAKSIAYAKKIPLIGINHIEAHISAIFLEEKVLPFPFIALVVSGGHTNLYRVNGPGEYYLLGQTRDDAAGEAFDKVAKLLELGYPGGVIIDQLAKKGNGKAIKFPRAFISKDSLDFSFSGIKTAVLYCVREREGPLSLQEKRDIVASFQEAVVDVLVAKTLKAAQKKEINRIVLAGGVAANTRLRARLKEEATGLKIDLFVPSPILCTDNAAMVAVVGEHYLKKGITSPLDLNAVSRWPAEKSSGKSKY